MSPPPTKRQCAIPECDLDALTHSHLCAQHDYLREAWVSFSPATKEIHRWRHPGESPVEIRRQLIEQKRRAQLRAAQEEQERQAVYEANLEFNVARRAIHGAVQSLRRR